MDIKAQPSEENIILVNDKILIALLAANNIRPVKILSTGWPLEPRDFQRDCYMAYRHTLQVVELIEQYDQRKVSVTLFDFLDSVWELEVQTEDIQYHPHDESSEVD